MTCPKGDIAKGRSEINTEPQSKPVVNQIPQAPGSIDSVFKDILLYWLQAESPDSPFKCGNTVKISRLNPIYLGMIYHS